MSERRSRRAPARPTEPVLRWRSRANSIDGIEQELARIWAQPNLHPDVDGDDVDGSPRGGPDQRDEPRRHRPPAGSRRALRGDDPGPDRAASVADARRLARRSRRALLARRPDPGPLRPAPRERAGDLRGDDLPDVRRRVRPPSRRDRRPAPHPRPAGHGLVARRAAVRDRARQRRLRYGRPARRRRLDVARHGARPDPPPGGTPGPTADRDLRFRARPSVALARGDRLDLRHPRLPALPPPSSAGSA